MPVVGLIFFSTQQTGALWSDAQNIAGGDTITSGKLDIAVGSGGTVQSDYPFTALAKAGMMPGEFAQAPLTVHNSGNVAMRYRLQNGVQSNPAVPLALTVSSVASEGACPTTGSPTGATPLYSGALVGAQMPAWRTLAPGTAEVLCLRGGITETAAQNASTTATFTFAAEVG
ncbi:hypothetical protein MPC38_05070 [Prescottella equi]|uniref:hypothetical protein n=1 Tax=Rhodococcus hoagii TaxID=43767 RepID=UPI000A0FD8EC|nr:hypothetical protein [Prescottella equi]ORL84001.1 hypothetical protein A5N71_01860 [Prescottella equi]UNQ40633.1 hypothetical protein MPC38_05070 [Prescottella equi]